MKDGCEWLILMLGDICKYSQSVHSFNLILQSLVHQLVLLNDPLAFKLIGLYMHLIHGTTTTRYVHHLQGGRQGELLPQHAGDARLSVRLRGDVSPRT